MKKNTKPIKYAPESYLLKVLSPPNMNDIISCYMLDNILCLIQTLSQSLSPASTLSKRALCVFSQSKNHGTSL